MTGLNDLEYNEKLKRVLSWPLPAPCENQADYDRCYERRDMLANFSYSSDKRAEAKRSEIDVLLGAYEKALVLYNRRFLLKDGIARLIAKYMAWTKYFTAIDSKVAFKEAKDHDVLRKTVDENGVICLYVVGLNFDVGDNTFTVDRRGRQHRQRNKTIGRQAIYVSNKYPFENDELKQFVADIPTLDPTFKEAVVGSGKNAIPGIAMPGKDRTTLYEYFMNSPHAQRPDFTPRDPWEAYMRPVAEVVNGELFS